MRVFDLLTTSCDESHSKSKDEEEPLRRTRHQSIRDKIKEYSDSELGYDQINMPEIEVSVYFVDKEEKLGTVDTVMKVKRVLRYHHLARCAVDDNDYPPNQEYFLYSCGKVNTSFSTLIAVMVGSSSQCCCASFLMPSRTSSKHPCPIIGPRY